MLNASLGTSKKYADIQESKIKLYIRPTDRNHYFPELFTVEGEEISIVELVLEAGVLEGVNFVAKEKIHEIAIGKIKEGKLVASNGKEYTTKKMKPIEYNIDGDRFLIQQGQNFGYKIQGKIITTKGLDQYKIFTNKGLLVKLYGILKKTSLIYDVFSFFNWASNPKESLSIPFVPTEVVGMAIEQVVKTTDEGVEDIIQDMLNKAKHGGLESVRKFIANFRSGVGVDFDLYNISINVASEILQGKIQTLEEMVTRNENEDFTIPKPVYVLYRIVDKEEYYYKMAVIESFFVKYDEEM